MTEPGTGVLVNSVLLGIGIGKYEDEHLDDLPSAVSDVEDVAGWFRTAGFLPLLVLDPPRQTLVGAMDDALPEGRLRRPGTVLVLIWTGHGEASGDTDSLQLLTADSRGGGPDMTAITADQIAQVAARSGASQILLIIDACHSGSAVIDVAAVVDRVQRKVADQERRWVGVLASCQDYERARDGALAKKLVELLTKGPVDESLRLRWNSYQAGVRGDDLIDAVVKEWDEDRQQPKQNLQGNALPILPNPFYQPNAPEQVVEHLLWAARGGGQSEAGIWFTGRVGPLRELVGAIRAGEPGLCVVTGPAGCGKSALAGRIVSLSNPEERTIIEAAQSMVPADLDPGESSVDTHVQVRGMTLERFSEQLGRGLRVVGPGPAVNHYDLLTWASNRSTSPVIVIDGLDEAGAEGFRIASELLEPLAQHALLIVATRDVPGDDVQPSLVELLGASSVTIDLEADPGATDRDVHDYVVARLTDREGAPIAEAMDPGLVAVEVVRISRADSGAAEGSFLLARILTSQLMEEPLDTSVADWQAPLAASVEEAFARDISRGRVLMKDGEALPEGGRELLSALAYSYGAGFPADDVWPAVASVLSKTGIAYDRLDAFWALAEHGRYVTASSLDGQAVYRLHQRLTELLRTSERSGPWRKVDEPTGAQVAEAIMGVYRDFIEAGRSAVEHPYLWRYAWLHAVEGGLAGIEALAGLADHEPSLRPDLAMALGNLANRYSEVGRPTDAMAPAERAVEIYEQLAGEDETLLGDLANTLNNLGIHYSAVGRRSDAVAPTERAVEMREQLSAENPAFLGDLASSLGNLANRYSEVGRPTDAVPPAERAVEIYERLAADNETALNSFASALNNLGIHYSLVGRRSDAVAPTERAVEMREQLSAENPAFLGDLASSLNNLGIRYGEVGRPTDAVAPTERAVEIYQQLSAENPAFLGDLASSLNNLGIRYNEVGRRADAVTPTERAVGIYERLATENPAFLGDLASSLNNLGVHYSLVGHVADAVAPTERAVEMREQLSAENPAFLGDLASSLNNLGNRYAAVGRFIDAVAPTERAAGIYEQLATENRAFLDDLSSSLNNLGIRYNEVGRRADAVAPTERAVEMREQLAAENPAYLNDLASSLNNLGIRYSEVGRRADAVAPTERAVEMREQLAAENPAYLNDLASSLNNLGIRYSLVGRPADAVAPTERAVEMREQLAAENPAFLGDLASSLGNLANRYGEVGRRADAVAPTERALGIYEQLATENPGFLKHLAALLSNLGIHYGAIGRPADALAPTERAVEMGEQLAAENPAFLDDLVSSLNNLLVHYTKLGKLAQGQRRWDVALKAFADDPRASVVLLIRRSRSDDEIDEAVEDLLRADTLNPGDDPGLTADLHGACRQVRSRQRERFDSVWQESAKVLPGWLLLDAETIDITAKWIDTNTWTESRDYLLEHKDRLVSEAGRAALAEIALVVPDSATMSSHEKILEESLRDGVDPAYRSLLLSDTVSEWRSLVDPQESRRFLLDHRDELLTDEAIAVVVEDLDLRGQALLDLARGGEEELAYAILEGREPSTRALAAARHDADPARLGAVAAIVLSVDDSDAGRARAMVHLAMSVAIAGELDHASQLLDKVRKDIDVSMALGDLADAISHRAQDAARLAPLIQMLTQEARADG